MGAHVPYDPPRWAVERFMAGLPGGKPADYYLRQANQWQVDPRHWLASELEQEEYQAIVKACYNAEVAAQDAQIGWLVAQLRATGLLDETVLVVVADHGDHLGERERLNHMFGVYQPLTHVPLLIRDPSGRLPHGAVVEPFVSSRRVFHTLLAAAGAATAQEEALALWSGNSPEPYVFSEGYALEWAIRRIEKERPGLVHSYGYDQQVRAIYGVDHKLISWGEGRGTQGNSGELRGTQENRFSPPGQRELYAIRTDPQETTDLSDQLPEQVNELETQLQKFIQRTEPVATAAHHEEVDPAVLQHLRSLGYIE
jgi:arylsulfatase A-like enzyme